MKKVFVGGSRSLGMAFPQVVGDWLDDVRAREGHFLVGDAPGVDATVQTYLRLFAYPHAAVYHSSPTPRHHAKAYPAHYVAPPEGVSPKERRFQTAKDKAMAREADAGIMVWDGRSVGTLMNVYRLAQQGKPCLLWDAAAFEARSFTGLEDWTLFAQILPDRVRVQVEADGL